MKTKVFLTNGKTKVYYNCYACSTDDGNRVLIKNDDREVIGIYAYRNIFGWETV